MFLLLVYVVLLSVVLGITAKLILLRSAVLAARARKRLRKNGQLLRVIRGDIRSSALLALVQALVGAGPLGALLAGKLPAHPVITNYLGLTWLLCISVLLSAKAWLNQLDTVWMLEQEARQPGPSPALDSSKENQ